MEIYKLTKGPHIMTDTLIELGMLDAALREPPFEVLRIHEGDKLSDGTYTIESLIGEGVMSRVCKATQKHVGREIHDVFFSGVP